MIENPGSGKYKWRLRDVRKDLLIRKDINIGEGIRLIEIGYSTTGKAP